MTDWRWEFQQKKKQLGIGVLQKPCILNLTTFIYASFHTVNSISNSANSMLVEMKADNDAAGGLSTFPDLKMKKKKSCQREHQLEIYN